MIKCGCVAEVPYGSQANRFKAFSIDEEGAFLFPFVPEGEWVLRLIAGGRRLVLQTRVRTGPGAVVEIIGRPEASLTRAGKSPGTEPREPETGL